MELSSAVLTNPYSTRAMDAAIDAALDMPRDEQMRRMDAMWKSVEKYDSTHWAKHIVSRFELPMRGVEAHRVAAA